MLGAAVGLLAGSIPGGLISQPGAFALVGMGAVFAGVVRAPITSIVMIFEMTGNYSMILPLMIANITSYAVASKLSPTPIYDALLEQDGIRLPHNEIQALQKATVGPVMTIEVDSLGEQVTVSEAFKYIESLARRFHAYPVLDREGRVVGLFTLNDLKRAMAAGLAGSTLKEVASHDLIFTYPDSTLDKALIQLVRTKVSQLLVVSPTDPAKLMGIITMHDVARALARMDIGPDAVTTLQQNPQNLSRNSPA
jgi:CIC family chloride channel protein